MSELLDHIDKERRKICMRMIRKAKKKGFKSPLAKYLDDLKNTEIEDPEFKFFEKGEKR